MVSTLRAFSLQPACLLAACVFYGLFSSPTPDTPGLAEAAIGLLLIMAIGLPALLSLSFNTVTGSPAWQRISTIILLYMVFVPAFIALLAGADINDIVRDIIPLFYQFLPLMLLPALSRARSQSWQPALLRGLLFVGVVFALRYFFIIGRVPWQVGHKTFHDEFLYLPLSPEILFTVLFLSITGISVFMRQSRTFFTDVIVASLCGLGALLCAASLAGMLLRASMVLIAAAAAFTFIIRMPRALPRTAIALFVIVSLALSFAAGPIEQLAASLQKKEDDVGINQRDAEFKAATDAIQTSPQSFLFGLGWGASVPSPAVGNLRVPYTHNFISYLLMKSGIVGTGAMLSYFALLFWFCLRRIGWRLSLLPPLIPLALAFTLYTSYKTLGFGLILSYLLSCAMRQSERKDTDRA